MKCTSLSLTAVILTALAAVTLAAPTVIPFTLDPKYVQDPFHPAIYDRFVSSDAFPEPKVLDEDSDDEWLHPKHEPTAVEQCRDAIATADEQRLQKLFWRVGSNVQPKEWHDLLWMAHKMREASCSAGHKDCDSREYVYDLMDAQFRAVMNLQDDKDFERGRSAIRFTDFKFLDRASALPIETLDRLLWFAEKQKERSWFVKPSLRLTNCLIVDRLEDTIYDAKKPENADSVFDEARLMIRPRYKLVFDNFKPETFIAFIRANKLSVDQLEELLRVAVEHRARYADVESFNDVKYNIMRDEKIAFLQEQIALQKEWELV